MYVQLWAARTSLSRHRIHKAPGTRFGLETISWCTATTRRTPCTIFTVSTTGGQATWSTVAGRRSIQVLQHSNCQTTACTLQALSDPYYQSTCLSVCLCVGNFDDKYLGNYSDLGVCVQQRAYRKMHTARPLVTSSTSRDYDVILVTSQHLKSSHSETRIRIKTINYQAQSVMQQFGTSAFNTVVH